MPLSLNHPGKPRSGLAKTPSETLRILVAEDNLATQKTMVQLLQCLQHKAQGVSNGVEVLEALKEQVFDVILMDVQMPRMNGLEATQRIRNDFSKHSQPHIIAMTGRTNDEEQQECLDAGMDLCLTKPVRMETLANTLSQLKPLTQFTEIASSAENLLPENLLTENPSERVLDAEVLAEIRSVAGENVNEFLVSVINEYLHEAPELLQNIAEAIAHNQASQMMEAANSLKIMSGFLGALKFSQLCEQLVEIAKIEFLSSASDLFATIQEEFARVEQALTAMRQSALT